MKRSPCLLQILKLEHIHFAGSKVDMVAGKVTQENLFYLYDYVRYTMLNPNMGCHCLLSPSRP